MQRQDDPAITSGIFEDDLEVFEVDVTDMVTSGREPGKMPFARSQERWSFTLSFGAAHPKERQRIHIKKGDELLHSGLAHLRSGHIMVIPRFPFYALDD